MCNLLIATDDMYLRSSITAILSGLPDYNLLFANKFDTALRMVLTDTVDLVLIHQVLGDLRGIDFIAVVSRIKPNLPFILFDDDMSSKTAMAAFRLGARDYMTYPIRPHLLLMQIHQCLPRSIGKHVAPVPSVPKESVNYTKLLDPHHRPLAFSLSKRQHEQVHKLIAQCAGAVSANFVGILDSDDNIIDAIGEFARLNIRELKRIIGLDSQSTQNLADVLGIDHFTATFWEGEMYNFYMIEIFEGKATFITITPNAVKSGIVWNQVKHTVAALTELIDKTMHLPAYPIFT